ncbi:hypothetical protein [Georgenia sp. Z1491]|uniref:hypothetical protein n=1 Tax=Georgenia sp. Z1491 TaxID=3416707 RepID=UPI003CED33DA
MRRTSDNRTTLAWHEAALVTTGCSMVSLAATFLVVWFVGQEGDPWTRADDAATRWGAQVAHSIGWVCAMLVATLGAILATLVATRRSDDPDAVKLRHHLTWAGHLTVAAFLPALLLVTWVSATSAAAFGTMFVLVPTLSLILASSVAIGTFHIPGAARTSLTDRDRSVERVDRPKDRPSSGKAERAFLVAASVAAGLIASRSSRRPAARVSGHRPLGH